MEKIESLFELETFIPRSQFEDRIEEITDACDRRYIAPTMIFKVIEGR